MATISPTISIVSGVPRVTWAGVSTADTMEPFVIQSQNGLAGAVQLTGTWGSSTVEMQISNDNSTYFTAKDVNNASISATSNSIYELSTSAAYIKPASSGGTADNVDIVLVMRG